MGLYYNRFCTGRCAVCNLQLHLIRAESFLCWSEMQAVLHAFFEAADFFIKDFFQKKDTALPVYFYSGD